MKKIISALSMLLVLVFSCSLLSGCGENIPQNKTEAITKLVNAGFIYVSDNTVGEEVTICFTEKDETGNNTIAVIYYFPTNSAAKEAYEAIVTARENNPVTALKNTVDRRYGKWVVVASEKLQEAFIK